MIYFLIYYWVGFFITTYFVLKTSNYNWMNKALVIVLSSFLWPVVVFQEIRK